MSYRGSLLTRIAGTVLIAFVWFAFLFAYVSFFAAPQIGTDLAILLLTGLADAAAIAVLWSLWFLRDRQRH